MKRLFIVRVVLITAADNGRGVSHLWPRAVPPTTNLLDSRNYVNLGEFSQNNQ